MFPYFDTIIQSCAALSTENFTYCFLESGSPAGSKAANDRRTPKAPSARSAWLSLQGSGETLTWARRLGYVRRAASGRVIQGKGDPVLDKLEIRTSTHSCLIDITAQVERVVGQHRIEEGLCSIFVPHTTAGITINENADPTVQSDLLAELDKMVPWEDGYSHSEGNSAAHIKASLMGSSQTVFVSRGRLQLGTWQGIYLAEFDGPRTRQVWIKILSG